MSKVRPNPTTLVDAAQRDAAFASVRGNLTRAIAEETDASRELASIFDQLDESLDFNKVTTIAGDAGEKVQKIVELHSAVSGYSDAVNELRAIDGLRQAPDAVAANDPEDNGLVIPGASGSIARQIFAQARDSGRSLSDRGAHSYSIAMTPEVMATLFTTAAGWAPEVRRVPGLVADDPQRPLQVMDILGPPIPTTQNSVKYMEESTFTNSAAEAAEGAANAESALVLTERDVAIRRVGTVLPVTLEQLEDEPMVEAYLDRRLPFMVRQHIDLQIMAGGGTAPALNGIINQVPASNHTVTSAYASAAITKPINDILRARTIVQKLGYTNPSHAIIHPDVWEAIELTESANGSYMLGIPSARFERRAWGLPVIVSTSGLADAATKVWGVVGDFANMADLYMRRDITVDVGLQGADFARNAVTMRAYARVALVVYRPEGFAEIARPST